MMLLIILSGIFIVVYYINKYYFKPKSLMKSYFQIFQNNGYKVYMHELAFMNLSTILTYEKGLQMYQDVLYLQKTVYKQFDVIIGNYLDKAEIIILNPDLIKQFYSMNHFYHKDQMFIKVYRDNFGNGLLFSEGDQWKLKRKFVSKVFNYDLLKENIGKISHICNKSFDLCEKKYKFGENSFKYFLNIAGSKIFNGVTMSCFFNFDSFNEKVQGMYYDQFMAEAISYTFEISQDPLIALLGDFAWKTRLTSTIRKFNRSIRIMKAKVMQIIRKRTDELKSQPQKEKSTDFVQAIYYQKLKNQNGFTLDEAELIDQLNTFLLAGTDSTARYFTMMAYFLGRNPRVLQKLRQEIQSLIKRQEDINSENLNKLTYLDWIQFETTRLFDVTNGIFQRKAIQDHFIKGIPIRKNTIISIEPTGNNYSEKYYRDPLEFRPERWESECSSLHPFVFMGFGARPRGCIGKHLALLASKIAIINLVRRYESIEVPQKITMNINSLYQPQPFDFILKKKVSPQ